MENNINKVLALKYRPKNFKELIGQDIMVETITNSIKQNKFNEVKAFMPKIDKKNKDSLFFEETKFKIL